MKPALENGETVERADREEGGGPTKKSGVLGYLVLWGQRGVDTTFRLDESGSKEEFQKNGPCKGVKKQCTKALACK